MKILVNFCLSVLILLVPISQSFSQQMPKAETVTLGQCTEYQRESSSNFFFCPPESVYGQPPVTEMIMGLPSVSLEGYASTIMIDNMPGFEGEITGITFWGAFQDTSGTVTMESPVRFKVLFIIESEGVIDTLRVFDLLLTGELFMADTTPVYRFDGFFPNSLYITENVLISVVQILEIDEEMETFPFIFMWLLSMDGDQQCLAVETDYEGNSEGFPLPADLAFCLKKGVSIPLSDCTLYIVMALILVFAVFRFRYYWYR
jgi:hypothetical protein